MAKTQEYKISSDGKKTTVTDTTVWGGVDGDRSTYAIIFGLLKYTTSGFSPCTLAGSDQVNIDDLNPSFVFNNKNDGYYKIKAVYALKNSAPATEGSVYYDETLETINLYTDGSWSVVTYVQLMTHVGDLIEEVVTDIGISPSLEKMMDKIWYAYYTTGQNHKGREYDSFQTLYALLIGARSSLLQSAYTEFDRTIDHASTLALRKTKEFKIQ